MTSKILAGIVEFALQIVGRGVNPQRRIKRETRIANQIEDIKHRSLKAARKRARQIRRWAKRDARKDRKI